MIFSIVPFTNIDAPVVELKREGKKKILEIRINAIFCLFGKAETSTYYIHFGKLTVYVPVPWRNPLENSPVYVAPSGHVYLP